MSRSVGQALPGDLLDRLAAARVDAGAGLGLVLCTVDADGQPRPAMLSAFEVVALDPGRLRLATYDSSRTAANLAAHRRVTLVIVDAGVAYYVKGRASSSTVPPPPGHAFFDVQVDQVAIDAADAAREGRARIVSGIRYAADEVHWGRAKEVLARLADG